VNAVVIPTGDAQAFGRMPLETWDVAADDMYEFLRRTLGGSFAMTSVPGSHVVFYLGESSLFTAPVNRGATVLYASLGGYGALHGDVVVLTLREGEEGDAPESLVSWQARSGVS
jgi:hypothetical protein